MSELTLKLTFFRRNPHTTNQSVIVNTDIVSCSRVNIERGDLGHSVVAYGKNEELVWHSPFVLEEYPFKAEDLKDDRSVLMRIVVENSSGKTCHHIKRIEWVEPMVEPESPLKTVCGSRGSLAG
jgi:hypothetical protein